MPLSLHQTHVEAITDSCQSSSMQHVCHTCHSFHQRCQFFCLDLSGDCSVGLRETKCTSIPRPCCQHHAFVFWCPLPAFKRKPKCCARQSLSSLRFPSLLLPSSTIRFSTPARHAGASHFSTAQTSKGTRSQLDVRAVPVIGSSGQTSPEGSSPGQQSKQGLGYTHRLS